MGLSSLVLAEEAIAMQTFCMFASVLLFAGVSQGGCESWWALELSDLQGNLILEEEKGGVKEEVCAIVLSGSSEIGTVLPITRKV